MAYALATSYAGEALLSGFNWFDGVDPNHGFVSYQNRSNAEAKGLYSVNETTGVVRLGVDNTNVYSLESGRPSIRLESKESFTQGLFIADFLHMPPSQCGLWPAFWAYGNNWPMDGEIDIIEGANDEYRNLMSAHTTAGCTISKTLASKASGTPRSTTCAVDKKNEGCGYDVPVNDTTSYGDAFNAEGGGVYAMEWASEYIKIWHFARGQIPGDIKDRKPTPDEWGMPHAIFGGESCDVGKHFKQMNLVININFCGDWPENIWGKSDGCGKYAPTCGEFVAKNPQAFTNTHWDVQYIDAYEKASTMPSSPPSNASLLPAKSISPTNPINSTTMMDDANTTTPMGVDAKFKVPAAASQEVSSSLHNNPASAASGSRDPSKVDEAAFLGCFGSSNRFQSFRKVTDRKDMTVSRCVELCQGAAFAGTYDTQCFCADSLDANTMAVNGEFGSCNHPCPGNTAQSCGGLSKKVAELANTSRKTSGVIEKASRFGKAIGSDDDADADAAGASRAARLANSNDKSAKISKSTQKRNLLRKPKNLLKHREAGQRYARPENMLLTVYGKLKKETKTPPPPPMAQGQNITRTPTRPTEPTTAKPASKEEQDQDQDQDQDRDQDQITNTDVPMPAHRAKFTEECDCEADDTADATQEPLDEDDLSAPPAPVEKDVDSSQLTSPSSDEDAQAQTPPEPISPPPSQNTPNESGQEPDQDSEPERPSHMPKAPVSTAGAGRPRTSIPWTVLVLLMVPAFL
ncbi:hypothetical protein E4U21_007279 [Claviceps maximensis]|nr:hypothetical protein E4U21_007279 [Claviceps maximensis]